MRAAHMNNDCLSICNTDINKHQGAGDGTLIFLCFSDFWR